MKSFMALVDEDVDDIVVNDSTPNSTCDNPLPPPPPSSNPPPPSNSRPQTPSPPSGSPSQFDATKNVENNQESYDQQNQMVVITPPSQSEMLETRRVELTTKRKLLSTYQTLMRQLMISPFQILVINQRLMIMKGFLI